MLWEPRMFDPDTVALMAQAPPLEGLDLTRLPQDLTEVYAEIVTARIRLRELAITAYSSCRRDNSMTTCSDALTELTFWLRLRR